MAADIPATAEERRALWRRLWRLRTGYGMSDAERDAAFDAEGWTVSTLAELTAAVEADDLERRRREWSALRPSIIRERLHVLAPRLEARGWRAIIADELDREAGPLAALERWRRGPDARPFLALLGGPGIGKTTAGAWWLTAADLPAEPPPDGHRLTREPRGAMVLFADLVRYHDARFARERVEAGGRPVGELLDEPRLVVDEVARDVPPAVLPAARAAFFELLDARMRPGHSTVLVANATLATLLRVYAGHGGPDVDARIVDRVRAHVTAHHFADVSRRPGVLACG